MNAEDGIRFFGSELSRDITIHPPPRAPGLRRPDTLPNLHPRSGMAGALLATLLLFPCVMLSCSSASPESPSSSANSETISSEKGTFDHASGQEAREAKKKTDGNSELSQAAEDSKKEDKKAASSATVAEVSLEAFVRHGSLSSADVGGKIEAPKSGPSPIFDLELGRVLKQYDAIRLHLAREEFSEIEEAAGRLHGHLRMVETGPMPAVTPAERGVLQSKLKELDEAASALEKATSLQGARESFATLSTPLLYLTTFHYHPAEEELPRVYFCPERKQMWLQKARVVGNPFSAGPGSDCGVRILPGFQLERRLKNRVTGKAQP